MRAAPLIVSLGWLGGLVGLPACGRALVAGDSFSADGGGADARAIPIAPIGRSYDVTATFTVMPPAGDEAGWTLFPRARALTLVFDDAEGHVLVGQRATYAAAAVARAADGTAHTSFTFDVPYEPSCTRTATITFDDVTLVESAGQLSGTGRGHVSHQEGPDVWTADLTATFAGVPDATAPAVVEPDLPRFSVDYDPLGPLAFDATEPLRPTTTARLVGRTSGDVVALAPVPIGLATPPEALAGFAKPDVMLRFGEMYTLEVTGLVDFAGNSVSTPPLTIHTAPQPPLAAQDGFESVSGDTYSGAAVVNYPPLTPIMGKVSLGLNTGFGGGFGFLPYMLGPSFTARLAVAPGARVVRFARQLVAPDPTAGAMFVGAIRVAALGQSVDATMNLPATDFTEQTLPGVGSVYMSPVATIELPLPPGAGGEIAFEIAGVTFQCGLPPTPTLLMIDDLRVE